MYARKHVGFTIVLIERVRLMKRSMGMAKIKRRESHGYAYLFGKIDSDVQKGHAEQTVPAPFHTA